MSVTVVVVDPAFEADAPLGLGSELEVVEELVGEGAVEALCFAVRLGPVGSAPARRSQQLVPYYRPVVTRALPPST